MNRLPELAKVPVVERAGEPRGGRGIESCEETDRENGLEGKKPRVLCVVWTRL